jgi:DNA-binding MarR family transcriptional regulator
MKPTDPFLTTLHEFRNVFMRHSMNHAMRFSRDSGCSMSQLGTLMIIHKRGTSAVSDIGDELGISNAAASQMLDRLLQDGLILRTEHPDDRRVKQIKLTEKGRQLLTESFEARHRWINELVKQFSSTEKEKIIEGLQILIDKAENLPSEDQIESE